MKCLKAAPSAIMARRSRADMTSDRPDDCTGLALDVATALTKRDYGAPYATTSRDYRRRMPLEAMQAACEAIVPPECGRP